jgi:hypothetical protein
VEITVTLGINGTQENTLPRICETLRRSLTKSCGREFEECEWKKISFKRQEGDIHQGTTVSPASTTSGAPQLLLSSILSSILFIGIGFLLSL